MKKFQNSKSIQNHRVVLNINRYVLLTMSQFPYDCIPNDVDPYRIIQRWKEGENTVHEPLYFSLQL